MRRVALFVDTSTSWGRRIIRGVNQYAREHGPWHLFVEARGTDEFHHIPPEWHVDGVIARISHAAMARQIQRRNVAAVNVSGIQLAGVDFPRVTTELKATVQMAARHLIDRGFKHFAYFSLLRFAYVRAQRRGFMQAVEAAGYKCATFHGEKGCGSEANWTLDMSVLAEWLNALPKPAGIFTWNAGDGRQIIHGCQWAGLKVPEEIAVLSGSDDELLCEISNIAMSGLVVAAEQIGHEAAAMLDRLMRGEELRRPLLLLDPLGVVTRQSTDTLAIDNAAVAAAVRFIRNHSPVSIRVRDVVAEVSLSRRSLERRFREVLGRTVAEEIRRVHLERAKELLLETEMPIPEVAQASGCSSAQYLIYMFNQEAGQTPLQYRKTMRKVELK